MLKAFTLFLVTIFMSHLIAFCGNVQVYYEVDGAIVTQEETEGKPYKLLVCDENDHIISGSFYGKDGKPTVDGNGVHRYALDYDEYGNVISYRMFNKNDIPIEDKYGIHMYQYTYNKQGKETSVKYFGANDKATTIDGTTHYIKVTYDEYGNCTSEKYYDIKGYPAEYIEINTGEYFWLSYRSIHCKKYKYDTNGNKLYEVFYDANGRQTASTIWIYDDAGRKTSESHFGLDGNPEVVMASSGFFHRIEWFYNSNGELIDTSYFDEEGNEIKY